VGAGAEIDIEGLDCDAEGRALYLTGSHSTKRKKPRGKDAAEDLERLATIKPEPARFVLARLPLERGTPTLRGAATLPRSGAGSLVAALADDPHLGRFVPEAAGRDASRTIPGKDNGFDIEGLACMGDRVLLGLRGPVLRGFAFVLELAVEPAGDGALALGGRGERPYRKHALDLDGLGVRELLVHGDDVLVLAGPTMVLDGAHRVYRWRGGPNPKRDSLVAQAEGVLEPLFDIPSLPGADRAEGLANFSWFDEDDSALVLYDSPGPARRLGDHAVLADVFAL
jgi:hypothetical protein